MMDNRYVWIIWASAFMIPWVILFVGLPQHRRPMLWASVFTAPFGLTEPFFVPEYWNPPSLFDLAARTGFDIESLIFCFGIGGVGAVLVNVLRGTRTAPMEEHERHDRRHRFHRPILVSPFVIFLALFWFPWNPIYPGIVSMLVGALLSAWCRPDLVRSIVVGGLVFLVYYAVFLLALELSAPGYIDCFWSFENLTGISLWIFPLEELLFALAFGSYWAGIYEHFNWQRIEPASS